METLSTHVDDEEQPSEATMPTPDGEGDLAPSDTAAGDELPDNAQPRFDGIHRHLATTLDLTDAVRLLVEPQEDDEPAAVGSDTYIDRVPTPTGGAHPDAIRKPVDSDPTVDGETGGSLIPPVETLPPQLVRHPTSNHELVPGGPRILRDRFALLEIARYRVMSFRQLQAQVFGDLHKAVLTRRMQGLTRAGFIETWEEHLVVGGHPNYAIPTKAGLAWALAELKAEAKGRPYAKLVAAMIGEAGKRPLLLAPRTAPPFLPHQDETNRVVAALEAIPELGITWASTWHRPFPNHVDHIAMPQPDAVLVATRDGKPHLVFLEHDRGQEAPASFARKKAARYHELSLYGLTEELFDFDDFTVWVTVNDVAEGKPVQRIRVLQSVSKDARMMRFTLAGWIPAHAHLRPAWFTPTTAITAKEHRPDVHDGLVGPFATQQDSGTMKTTAELLRSLRASNRAATIEDDSFAT